MPKRSGNVDGARFIAALIIVTNHLSIIGVSGYPFHDGWIFVEFFLMITGYYTAKHFDDKDNSNSIKDSILYTINKFIVFLPYTIAVTILGYITEGLINVVYGDWNIKCFIGSFMGDFWFDIFLITEPMSYPLIVPIWYLSAMLFIFPLFSWLMQIKNRYWIMVISFMYPLLYYSKFTINGGLSFPQDILRILAGLCLGSFIYECIYAFRDYIDKINKLFLTILEVVSFMFVFISTFRNWRVYRLDLLCFVVCGAIMLPNLSYTKNISGKVFVYLGKLSMPVYIIHWYLGTLVDGFGKLFLWNGITKLILYYGVSILISIVAMHIVDHWKWFNNIINKPLELRD